MYFIAAQYLGMDLSQNAHNLLPTQYPRCLSLDGR